MPATTPCPARRQRRAAPEFAALAALLLAGLASSCGPAPDQFAPECPGLAVLRDGGEITRFANTGRDATDMVLKAKITAVPAKCQRDGRTAVLSTLNVQADVARGPAAKADSTPATYFIAVMDGNKVLQQRDFLLTAQFPPNADKTTFKSEDIELTVPVSAEKSAAAYQIYVGFRLSAEELAYNRSRHLP